MNSLLLIPARGGSKGVPKKNISLLGGRPLIAWTIEQALASNAGEVIVSTDCETIAAAAKHAGAEVPFMRPSELATDEAGSFEVAEHALRWLGENNGAIPQILVLLQPTSPFRTAADIVDGIALLESSAAPAVVGVCAAGTHPWMTRKVNTDGTLECFCEVPIGSKRRQDFPKAYEVNGAFYAIRTRALLEKETFEPPGTLALVMPCERSLDIDTPEDFEVARQFLCG